jgi:hypothetical protein
MWNCKHGMLLQIVESRGKKCIIDWAFEAIHQWWGAINKNNLESAIGWTFHMKVGQGLNTYCDLF